MCLQIKDCHAEVLARRGQHNTLWNELQKIESNIPSEYCYVKDSGKIGLKQNFALWLVCNKAPCGDCSQTYCKDTEQMLTYSNSLPQKNLKQGLKSFYSEENKQVINKIEDLNIFIDNTSLCEIRMKPSRKDFPIDKVGLSYSCSDKIMMWNILGVQGNLLSNFYSKIFIKKVILLNDSATDSKTAKIPDNLLKESILRGISFKERFPHKKLLTKKVKNSLSTYKPPEYNKP